ncbi:MAG: DNA polymerase III, subunit gamma and tau [Legionellales bacterium RIFCSPHIGHO2_12_FULL_35_11]|nr:MAG: DNA polymerase III, subunit gamma and tau [Legionellales bacterium RIFCSPHIGHO2_12_FULL_35_11]
MSYIALARKYRPKTFAELLGQDHLTNALINSIERNRIHHAYLFTGTRGVGKTSVARLLAKSLNCEEGISANPCLKCASCQAFQAGRFLDLIEIDGASKTKVEDTREILENVQYAPSIGRFKIYLIDEVHMLSQHSFNALLKTLEEPPAHVKFLLATTDPQKIPITVLSRCLQFSLKHVESDIILSHIQNLLNQENIKYELPALKTIANAAKGSIRDALSLLDQSIVGCRDTITNLEVNNLLGYTNEDYAIEVIKALSGLNPQRLLEISKNINTNGALFNYVVDEILSYLHQIAISQIIPKNNLDELQENEIVRLGKLITPENIQTMYQIALKGSADMQLAPTTLIGFEILLLRMYTFTLAPKQNHIVQATASLNIQNKEISNTKHDASKVKNNPTQKSSADLNWTEIITKLPLKGLALTAAENAELIDFNNNIINLRADKSHESIFTSSVIGILQKNIGKLYNRDISIKIQYGQLQSSSPAEIKNNITQKNKGEAIKSIEEDAFIKQLQTEFSAELVKNSIVSLKD